MNNSSKPRTRAGVPNSRVKVDVIAPGLVDKKNATKHGWVMFGLGATWVLLMFPAFLVGIKYIIHDVSWLYNWLIG